MPAHGHRARCRPAPVPLDRYQVKLLAFLGVAIFFEGFDTFAPAQVLVHIVSIAGVVGAYLPGGGRYPPPRRRNG